LVSPDALTHGRGQADMVDLERDYAKSLKHIAKKLGLPKQHSDGLKLSHLRDGGREVEIYDGK
jgi:hypothetical protein